MVVPQPSPSVTDTAIAFYLRHYTGYGRDITYSRGFFEVLIPIYRSQKHGSALSHAIAALASLVLSIWREGAPGTGHGRSPIDSYTHAVASLRRAVADGQQVKEPATLLAVLALQLYENVTAIYNFRPAPRAHHDGALSLLASTMSGQKSGMAGACVRKFVRHVEISSAMRCRRPVRTTVSVYPWSQIATVEPYNPSVALDNIVADIAGLQAAHSVAAEQTRSLHYNEILIVEAKRIDSQLLDWARSIPLYWEPFSLVCGDDFDSSIPSYSGICDNYPSCQIANIWNLWRLQRLTLVKLILNTFDTISRDETSWFVRGSSLKGPEEIDRYQKVAQDLVDSVCQSVAFYLGNRTTPSTMADLTDPHIALLGKIPFDSINILQDHNSDLQSDDHKRHIIAQGPWHIMSPLSRLVAILSEDTTFASLLRPGQHHWIRTQFLRVLTILHIFSVDSEDLCDVTADFLAKQVRKGAIFMSGP